MCDSFSTGAPFSGSGRMGEDVVQIQDKARGNKGLKCGIPNAPIHPCLPPSFTQVYELHLQGSPTSNGVGACVTHLPGTKRYVYVEKNLWWW